VGIIRRMGDFRYVLVVLITLVCSVLFNRAIRKGFSRFASQERKAGKELIYRYFPRKKKPLGGGVALFLALCVGLVTAQTLSWLGGWPILHLSTAWLWLACGLAFAGIGLIDDWRKVTAAQGLTEWAKLLLQVVAALFFTVAILIVRDGNTAVYIPFFGSFIFGKFFLPFGMLIIVGFTNAVNLTDGMDGLAGASLTVSYAGYLALALLLQHDGIPPLIPLLALAGLLGFLYYNRPPAKIIMGDTGALGLGAALGALALLTGTEWLLVLIGAPFVINTLSVLVQVAVIKFFRGPIRLLRHQTTEIFRPFLCTPLHHHFQWLAWGPWPILALYTGVGALSVLLALLAWALVPQHTPGIQACEWFWTIGVLLQVGVLLFAALQKAIRANYFLGLGVPDGGEERMLTLYKGLPMVVLGMRAYTLEEVTELSEDMVTAIAAESILWRNISEIEARATMGKIYAEYKLFDKAAAEWEEIPLRNLLIRESLVVQLGKIYFGRDELLRAIKLWEQLPASRLARNAGLPETIQSAKVRIGHLAGRLYHQAREHVADLERRVRKQPLPSGHREPAELVTELESALRYTQDLRDLLAYEQQRSEGAGEGGDADSDQQQLYRRMDQLLTQRREDLVAALSWVQELITSPTTPPELSPLQQLANTLGMTAAEIGRALDVNGPLPVREFARLEKASRNMLYRISLDTKEHHLPECIIAKCYEETQVSFFSACYRRERGVLRILQEAGAPAPRLYGGHLGSRTAVLFQEDLGTQDLATALITLGAEDRSGKIALLRRAISALVHLHTRALPVLPQLEREIAKIVKEVLTPEYFLNTTAIALDRILALNRRRLSHAEHGRLENALRPISAALLAAPKTFIHFEFTPGNLLLVDGNVVAVDFEQATMGPAAFDMAALCYAPEVDLTDTEIRGLLDYYHELLPADTAALVVQPEIMEAAAIVKLIFYAGAAANFYRKYEEGRRLLAMDWYLHSADRLLSSHSAYRDLADLLRNLTGPIIPPKVVQGTLKF